MPRAANTITINQAEFQSAIDSFDDAADVFGGRWLKNTQARKARKHFVPDMRRGSPSDRIREMITVTTAKKYTRGPRSIRVGVVKNDPDMFPDFSAQALASVLEHGTVERYRQVRRAGFVVGRVSTGKVKPQPFLRPAFDQNKAKFMADMEDAIQKKIEKEF